MNSLRKNTKKIVRQSLIVRTEITIKWIYIGDTFVIGPIFVHELPEFLRITVVKILKEFLDRYLKLKHRGEISL